MTGPFDVQASTLDFGPDQAPTVEAEKSEKRAPRRDGKTAKERATSLLNGLGNNDKPRSGIRALTEADRLNIVDLYTNAGQMIAFVHKSLGTAIGLAAEPASRAWVKVAEKNNQVRKFILALGESSAWFDLFMAHVPVLLAAVPPSVIEKSFLGMFQTANDAQSEEDYQSDVIADILHMPNSPYHGPNGSMRG